MSKRRVFPDLSLLIANQDEVREAALTGKWVIGIDIAQGPNTCVEGYQLENDTFISTDVYELPD